MLYDVQYIKHHTSGLPEDDVVNTLHFTTNEGAENAATASAIAGWVAAAHHDATSGTQFLESLISEHISRTSTPTIKVYNGEVPGSPLAIETQLAMRATAFIGLPSEVAVCLSFRGDYGTRLEVGPDDADVDAQPERPRSRVRGRIFEGPWGTNALQGATGQPARPSGHVGLALVDYGRRLAAIGNAGTMGGLAARWVVVSKATGVPVSANVTQIWADDSWDTQRRRGIASSARDVLAVTQPVVLV